MTTDFNFPNHDYSKVLYTTLKNEGPYVLDWICYHLKIGFTHFVIVTNNCEDGTDNLLRQLEDFGIVTHRNNPEPHPQGILKHAFNKLQGLPAIEQAEWLMQLDIDEYLRIDIGRGEVKDLITAIGIDAHAVSIPCQIFGNNNIDTLSDAPIITQFTRASHPLQAIPAPTCALKAFYKNGIYTRLAPNRPNGLQEEMLPDEINWLDGDGVITKKLVNSKISDAAQNGFAFGTSLGRVNRYAVQSLDAFSLKCKRGFITETHPITNQELLPHEYWLLNNWNIVENTEILKHHVMVEGIKLLLLENAKIKKLHRKSFRIHRQWINQVRRKEVEFFEPFTDLKPLDIGSNISLINPEISTSDLKDWFFDTKSLQQKLMLTTLLKFYIDGVDYGSSATKLDK